MKTKTAIRQLIEFIDKEQGMFKDSFVLEIKNKAKELESVNEQHIKDGFDIGWANYTKPKDFEDADQYFNETYGK